MRSFFFFIICASLIGTLYAQCDGCKDATYAPSCPEPAFCGFAPIICSNCTSGQSSPTCTSPTWCANYQCSEMCMDGMPMKGCPDPGACGFKPIKCKGCIPGQKTATCPQPTWCGNFTTGTPPCYKCMEGMAMTGCPDPGICGLPPLCIDCMPGMAMPSCPRPEACIVPPPSNNCTNCTVGMSTASCPDPGVCGLKPLCVDCMAGMAMPLCPRPEACSTKCMMNMYFGVSSDTCLLLQQWHITNSTQWFVASVCILLLCFLREFFAVYRTHRLNQTKMKRKEVKNNNNNNTSIKIDDLTKPLMHSDTPTTLVNNSTSTYTYMLDSIFYTVSVILSYLIMLLIMTYNVGICVIVVLSCGVSHFIVTFSFVRYYRKCKEKGVHTDVRVDHENNNQVQTINADHCCENIDFDSD